VDGLFAILLLAVAISSGWLVARHDRAWDWTATASNSLTRESLLILARLESPLRATIFAAPDTPLGKAIEHFLARYARVLPDMEIVSLDPQLFPEQARDADVSLAGQILLEYRGRRETLNEVSERAISAAISRLFETRRPWVAVIEGHGERAIDGAAGADLGRFGQELKEQGYLARPLDLAAFRDVPDNTRLVILSTPDIALFPGEVEGLSRYLDRGGNLLWLLDPGPLNGLDPVAEQLGLTILPGVVVDAAAARLGFDNPAVAVIADDPDAVFPLPGTTPTVAPRGAQAPPAAVFPGSVAFETQVAPGWTLFAYLATGAQSWNETGQVAGEINRDEVVGERSGPLPVVLAMTRTLPATDRNGAAEVDREQRVLVVGDGDFLSNAQLGAAGNRALGMRLLRWLSHEEALLELPPLPSAATPLILDSTWRMLLGLGALVVLPGLFLSIGLAVRWQRWRGR
jgi:hypothetical protein